MRFLRLLLRLYPASHRRRYGAEMLAVVEYRLERGGRGVLSTWTTVLDLVRGAAGVWKDRIWRWMMGTTRGFGLDARFLLRSLRRSRAYVATAVLVLAGAVAVQATVFSYVRGTLLHEPPYPNPEAVMVVWGSNAVEGQIRDVISGPNFIDLQERTTALGSVAAFHSEGVYLMVDGRPGAFEALEVTADFFSVLEVTPMLGRVFDERDRTSGAPRTVIVSHAFWRDRLDADPSAVGRRLEFGSDPHTVIGVLPEGFEFISPVPFFVPLRDDLLAADARTRIHYHVVGRLAGGASAADANREAEMIMAEIVAEHPTYAGWSFLVEPFHRVSVEAVRPVIVVLSVTVSLVLLVALVNLATLFRIRALARGSELAVRSALGAGRVALVRVLLLETVTLAALGAGLGLLVAPFLLERVAGMVPTWIAIPDSAARVPVLQAVLDPLVAAFAFGGAVLGSLVLNVPTLVETLRGASVAHTSGRRVRGGIRSIRALVGIELTVATVLCVGAGLTARSASRLLAEQVGMEPEGVLAVLFFADVWDWQPEERVQYFRDVVEAVERVPGVRRAGITDYVDFLAEDDYARIYFLDRDGEPVFDLREEWRRIDRGFLEAAGMSLLAGRPFESSDFLGPPRSAVVNQAFATKHYANRSPVGERISTHNDGYRDLEIVGVVSDVRSLGPAAPPPPMLYVPNQGDPRGTQGILVRVAGDPMSYGTAVQDAVWSIDPSQPIERVQPMTELVDAWVAIPRATRALVSGLAVLAWALATLGVFGVVAYAVRTRRSELGIRLALGATPDRLEIDQVRAISPMVLASVGVGLAIGALGARAARAVLYEVAPLDPLSLVGATIAMTGAALVATYVPARRAGRVDPTEVIRTE